MGRGRSIARRSNGFTPYSKVKNTLMNRRPFCGIPVI
jgi:hypothetical protein